MARQPVQDQLDSVGDLDAPVGSKERTVAVFSHMLVLLENGDNEASRLSLLCKEIRETEGYKYLLDRKGRPFTSWESFCVADRPIGLGYDAKVIELVIKERHSPKIAAKQLLSNPPVLADHGGDRKSEQFTEQENQVTQRNLKIEGDTNEYWAARIERDRPGKLAEYVDSGKSPRQIATELGDRKQPSALDKAKKAFLKLNPSERQQFTDWLESETK